MSLAETRIKENLHRELDASHVDIVDFSWQHAGHAAMQGAAAGAEATHLQLTVVSPQFEGTNLINRHRMVHAALKSAFENHLHALVLKTYSPNEWATMTDATPD